MDPKLPNSYQCCIGKGEEMGGEVEEKLFAIGIHAYNT